MLSSIQTYKFKNDFKTYMLDMKIDTCCSGNKLRITKNEKKNHYDFEKQKY